MAGLATQGMALQEEEVDRRAAAEKRSTDLQRTLQTEQDERKRAEERARDSRALVRTLEGQLSRREPSQVSLPAHGGQPASAAHSPASPAGAERR